MPGTDSSPLHPSRATATAGSRASSAASGAAAAASAAEPDVGSAVATSSAPASSSACTSRSRAWPSRASSATRVPWSAIRMRQAEQVEHVVDQLVLLIGLAEVTFHADLERALAVLFAGARSDHHDRHLAQAGVGLHVGGQLVAVHARH